MIQDISPKVYNNQYSTTNIVDDSIVLIYDGENVYVKKNGDRIEFPKYMEMPSSSLQYIYLFSVDEELFFLGFVDELLLKENNILKELDDSGFTFENVSVFRNYQLGYLGFVGITGYQLYCWYRDNVYCGRCSSKMEHSHSERMVQCEKCGNIVYPKISPAVIVAVTDGDNLLMTKYAGRDYKRYALVAGFTEIGETIEQTVEREVMEEVGLKVKNITYYKSQPWSFSGSLLMGFFAEVDGDTTIKMDESELSVAEWFPREDVPGGDDEISLTREMMGAFKNKKFKVLK